MAKKQSDGYREGSRWINTKPSGEELAQWFQHNVKLHEGLEHADYVQGIVLIPQTEKVREPDAQGNLVDQFRQVFTPYPTAAARLAYFRDWAHANGFLKVIEPDPGVSRNDALPPGFWRYAVTTQDQGGREKLTNFIGYSASVSAFLPEIRVGGRGREVLAPHRAAKIVPVLRWAGARQGLVADENAPAKAETGATGRALGLAGMLVIPGVGVATAEDVQETLREAETAPAAEPQAQLPNDDLEPQSGRERVAALIGQLQEYPEALEQAKLTAASRKMQFEKLTDQQLRGAVRLLERTLEDARKPDA